jgi:hypothetical protein
VSDFLTANESNLTGDNRITGTQKTIDGDIKKGLDVFIPGDNIAGRDYDYMELGQTATVDTYTFKLGGSGGSTVFVVTITFTDSSKETIDNVAWS